MATPALILNYQLNESTKWNTKLFATIGDRSSVGFLQSITVKDSMNSGTGEYNNRTVQVDNYRNYGLESRIITDYKIGKLQNTLSGGIRLYTGTTHRMADGNGTTGSSYDVSIIGNYPRDINFDSKNAAAFAENIFRFSDKFYIIPGIRLEWLEGAASGRNGYTSGGAEILLQNINRSEFCTLSIGAEYHIAEQQKFSYPYNGWLKMT
jgi:Fe(3+) dicitrate transport protein